MPRYPQIQRIEITTPGAVKTTVVALAHFGLTGAQIARMTGIKRHTVNHMVETFKSKHDAVHTFKEFP